MKKIALYIITSISLLLLPSCEKIVNMDLNPAPEKLVIDATIGEGKECQVTLSMLQDFWDQSPRTKVKGANITITDGDGTEHTLFEVQDGLYVSAIVGVAKKTYELNVKVNGETYTISSYLPPVVPLDSIYIYSEKVGDEYMNMPCIVFKDPGETDNYYYAKMYINDYAISQLYIRDDEFQNGLVIKDILGFDHEEDNQGEKLKAGDKIRVEMQSIDKYTYRYYESMSTSMNLGNNPISNFKGGDVLGNFKAYSKTSIEMITTEEDIKKVK